MALKQVSADKVTVYGVDPKWNPSKLFLRKRMKQELLRILDTPASAEVKLTAIDELVTILILEYEIGVDKGKRNRATRASMRENKREARLAAKEARVAAKHAALAAAAQPAPPPPLPPRPDTTGNALGID